MKLFGKVGVMLMTVLVSGCVNSMVAFAQTTDQITLDNCRQCAKVCTTTLQYCTEKKGRYGQATVTNALKDAISACKSAEDFIARGSKLQSKLASICAEACTVCAKSCESFKTDATMRSCADECRKCSGNCNKIASVK